MSTASVTAATLNKPRLQGFALISVVTSLMLALFLEALDQGIVGTAMPRIIAQLHGLDRYSWVVTAYILASMTMIPIVGKLSDQFGRKWFLLSGTALFLFGSLLAGASTTMNQLIFFRAVQGLGSGIGIALIATVMADLFPPEERAKWSSLFGLVYGVSSLLGPTLGGWLAEHGPLLGSMITPESRWRWVFYINMPFGLLALTALVAYLPTQISEQTRTWMGWQSLHDTDAQGALLCAAATICLMLGLTWGGDQVYAWASPQVFGMLVSSLLLFALFVRAERKAKEPMLPLDLFRNQIFSAGSALSLLQGMVLLALVIYLPLFFQGVLGISPTSAGLVMTPFSLSMVAGAILSGVALNKLKRYQVVALLGASLMTIGALLIALMTPSTSLLLAILFMVIGGIGIGVFFSVPMLAIQNTLPASQLGVSTAATRYLGQVGATLGIAIVGAVVTSTASGNLMSHLPTSTASKLALSGALTHGFVAVLVFAVSALVVVFFLKERLIGAAQKSAEPETADQAPEEAEEAVEELACA